ncbi:ribonuclease H-like domain-containing protein [Amanita rubescens]|nr:ribonuclease H-like domain-containing protein [Amanita rubescens]
MVLVDTIELLHDCLADISPIPVPTQANYLAVDIEGVNLCRRGRICIVQLQSSLSQVVWLVDVTVLGAQAFDEVDKDGRSLRSILQGPDIQKWFYDVRNDSDALYNLYGVNLNNVYDLQLLELANRLSKGQKPRFLKGLGKSTEEYLVIDRDWQAIKEQGMSLFVPSRGGHYEIFEKRPLDPRLVTYCEQDVTVLFKLAKALRNQMGMKGKDWEFRVYNGSISRVALSWDPRYRGDESGPTRTLAPLL